MCPDSFSVCAAPNIGLGRALVAVSIIGLGAGVIGGIALLAKIRRIPIGPTLLVLAASIAALLVNRSIVPPGPVVYYDEYLHAEATENIASRTSGHPCCAYEGGKCVDGGPIMWPLATHVASAAIMRGFSLRDGISARVAFNRFASFIAPLVAFVWCLLLVGDAWAAALAGLALALWPGLIRLQSTADLSTGAALFALCACASVEVWRKQSGWAGTAATIGFLALACHSRLEMSLIAPWIVWRAPKRATTVGALVFILAPLAWMYAEGAQHNVIGWTHGLAESFGYLRAHLPGNLGYLALTSPVVAIAALLGVRRQWPLALTVAAFLIFISAYHIGEFHPIKDADGFRYAVPIVAMMMPLVAAAFTGMRPVFVVVFALIFALPLTRERYFLSTPNPVAALTPMVTRRWLQYQPVITRSVAYAHETIRGLPAAGKERDGAIEEHCSADRIDHIQRWGRVYVRTWGDDGPTPIAGMCPIATPEVSPDGKGAWLFDYSPGNCR